MKFFILVQVSKHDLEHLLFSAQSFDLAPIFGDLSHSDKLSEINQPLVSQILGFFVKAKFHSCYKSMFEKKKLNAFFWHSQGGRSKAFLLSFFLLHFSNLKDFFFKRKSFFFKTSVL